MLHAIIMAGGSGTRFWPASRNDAPKQLLRLVGSHSMIRQTADRLAGLIPADRQLVVTNKRLCEAIRHELPELPASAIVGEPCKRDTAPCIGLAALLLLRDDADATMAVMPADHVIRPTGLYQAAIAQAARLVDDRPRRIVTFGVKPSYPAEVFGYIERGEPVGQADFAAAVYNVKQFKEKPDAATAEQYLASGRFYWNSGIFVWKAQTILEALGKRQPEMLRHLETIVAAWDTPEQAAVFAREFAAIKGISIDYAVMEGAVDVAVIEAPFEWDDLGGWQSLARLIGTDDDGNTIVGRHLGMNTTGTIVRTSDDHLVVTLGLNDTIVVHTRDATLVASKHDEESIRNIVKELESRSWIEYL
jgi:mannose-1-phosphate guanylyltransferase